MNTNANPSVPTFKAPSTIVAKESQQSTSSTLSAGQEATDPLRKKSGFVITRIDKASISSALENESDMENEPFNDRGGTGGNRSPGSSSVISETSSIFDDAVSPEKAQVPSITLHGASPVVASTPSKPILKPLNAVLASVQEQENAVGSGGLSPTSAASSSKDASSSTSTSRFHIIKIDTGPYKRGRWNCRDFDESCSNLPSSATRSDMIAVGGPRSGSSNCSSGKQSYYVVEENGRATAVGDGAQTPLLLLATAVVGNAIDQHHNQTTAPSISADSQQQRAVSPLPSDHHPVHLVVHEQSAPPNLNDASSNLSMTIRQQSASPSLNGPSSQQVPVALKNKFATPSGVDLNNATAVLLDSIMVGRRQHQSSDHLPTQGDNRDALSVGGNQSVGDAAGAAGVANSGAATAGGPSVAIDNKIEQAMDLVKTHLLYAVREEVEVLKEKIIDLEKKVFRLETENKLLREYAPPEILQQIQQSGVGQTVSSVLNSSATGVPQQSTVLLSTTNNLQAIAAPVPLQAITAPITPIVVVPGSDTAETSTTLAQSFQQAPPSS